MGRKALLAFDDLVAHPYGAIDLTLSIGEDLHQREFTLMFFVVKCIRDFKGILGRSFIEKLDAVTFTIHMNIT